MENLASKQNYTLEFAPGKLSNFHERRNYRAVCFETFHVMEKPIESREQSREKETSREAVCLHDFTVPPRIRNKYWLRRGNSSQLNRSTFIPSTDCSVKYSFQPRECGTVPSRIRRDLSRRPPLIQRYRILDSQPSCLTPRQISVATTCERIEYPTIWGIEASADWKASECRTMRLRSTECWDS